MSLPGTTSMTGLLNFLEKLSSAKIHYTLADHTRRAVMVCIAVPGERWEVEFEEDGAVAVEVFRSNGAISSAEKLEDLFLRFSD